MRLLLKSVLGLGCILLLGAAFLSVNQAITDDDRARFQDNVNEQAQDYEEARGLARRTDFVG